MKIKLYSDTDTAFIEFSEAVVAETREITENIYADLDAAGNLVAMTIEHASQYGSLEHIPFQQHCLTNETDG